MAALMALVFLPGSSLFFLWGEKSALRRLPALATGGEAASVELVVPEGRRSVAGRALPLIDTASQLAVLTTAALELLPSSFAVWGLASKLAIELVARERVVPTLARRGGRIEARWAAALSTSEDAANVAALARSMPPAAHAVPVADGEALEVWAPDALLRAYLDAVADALLRASEGAPALPATRRRTPPGSAAPASRWEQRWSAALAGPVTTFEAQGFAERSVVEDLERWSEAALGARDRLRACFRLELPLADGDPFLLRFLLQSPDDPSLIVSASEVWSSKGRNLEKLGRAFRDPQESLLEALGRAARLFPLIARSLAQAKPEALELDPASAWEFIGNGAAALADAGFSVIVPAELTASGQRRLRLRMRVGGKTKVAGAVAGNAGLGMDELLSVDWEAVLGDQTLSARELTLLAKQKAPLVRYRGAWVAIDTGELAEIQARLAAGPSRISLREAMRAALQGEAQAGNMAVAVSASGSLAELIERIRQGVSAATPVPVALRATLRPYQQRGLAWLATLGALGFGACLADDMGLGKTIQLLALLLRRVEHAPDDTRPSLLVAPTSVIGNWES